MTTRKEPITDDTRFLLTEKGLRAERAEEDALSDIPAQDLEEDLTDLCAQMQEGGEWDKEAIRGLAQEMGRRERMGR